MFRSTKRRKRPTGRAFRTDDGEDDDDEEGAAVTIIGAKKAPSSTRPVVVVAGGSGRRTKGKAKRLYSGSRSGSNQSSMVLDTEEENNEDGKDGATTASIYSKDALAQLMAEQKASYTKKPPLPAAETEASSVQLSPTKEDADVKETRVRFETMETTTVMKAEAAEEEFMALDGTRNSNRTSSSSSSHPDSSAEVLAGDEALRRSGAMARPGLLPRNDFLNDEDDDDVEERMLQHDHEVTEDGWEARLAHRAGITTTIGSVERSSRNTPPPSNTTTLDSIRDSVARSLRQNQAQQNEIADRIRRRQQEVTDTTTLTHHQAQVIAAGTQLEYYQHLRNRLCAWVGAMQELQPKIQAVLLDPSGSLCTIQGEWAKVDAQVEWERDVVLTVLQEQGLVEQVIGSEQQPMAMPAVAAVMEVDEFGRNVKSRHALRRDKLRQRRRRIRDERQNNSSAAHEIDEDPDLNDEEQERLRERHSALRAAATVAWNELDADYTKLDQLIDVFAEWHGKYPKEYEQCYASLSLADLASVFVQSELCQAESTLWAAASGENEESNENEWSAMAGFRWVSAIKRALAIHVMDSDGVDRLVEKAFLPVLDRVVEQKGVNLLSRRQVRALGCWIGAVASIGERSSLAKGMMSLQQRTERYIKERLDEISVPILVPSAAEMLNVADEEVSAAVRDATVGQLCRMEKAVSSIVECLFPAIDSVSLATRVLEFVSQKFLFVLSSILRGGQPIFHYHGESPTSPSPATILRRLHDVLQSTDWLDRPELMLQTAPLRAAMAAYTPTSS